MSARVSKQTLILAAAIAALALLLTSGWSWVALAYYAQSYPTTQRGETANVAIHETRAYVTRAERGLDIVDLHSGDVLKNIAPPRGSQSIDDLAIADGLLFVLDARPPGQLSVLSLDGRVLAHPVGVAVGPFSGVSAGGGHVIVSGGTSQMSLRTYDAHGALSNVIATADFGRGQPDVLLDRDGKRAFVSTHDWGPYFSMTNVRVANARIEKASSVDLDTYGFTPGGAKPASFPLQAALRGDTLVVAHHRGLAFIDARDLEHPRLETVLDLGVKAVDVDVRDNIAAVVGSSPRPMLILVDIDQRRILKTLALRTRSRPTSVAIGDTHIAVAAHDPHVLLITR